MAERMTASWTSAPHFYLVREVNVSRLATWRERASKQTSARITYTDLLVKLVAAALVRHPAAVLPFGHDLGDDVTLGDDPVLVREPRLDEQT